MDLGCLALFQPRPSSFCPFQVVIAVSLRGVQLSRAQDVAIYDSDSKSSFSCTDHALEAKMLRRADSTIAARPRRTTADEEDCGGERYRGAGASALPNLKYGEQARKVEINSEQTT